MIWPLLETLDFIEPSLPTPVAVRNSWTGIRGLAARIPEAVSAGYLECHLSETIDRVDFLVCVYAPAGGQQRLAQHLTSPSAAAALQEPAWLRTTELAVAWNTPGSVLQGRMPLLWLEFDNPAINQRGTPCVGVCTDPTTLESAALREFARRRSVQEVASEVLTRLVDDSTLEWKRAVVSNCIRLLPPGGSLVHLSVMLARHPQTVKMSIVLPRSGLLSYLEAIGWPGNGAWIEDVLAGLCPPTGEVKIDLAVDHTVQPYLGFELLREADRLTMLDRCAETGICGDAARVAVRSWPGSTRELFQGQTWQTRVSRWADIKVLCRPDGSLGVKSYLGFQPHFSLF